MKRNLLGPLVCALLVFHAFQGAGQRRWMDSERLVFQEEAFVLVKHIGTQTGSVPTFVYVVADRDEGWSIPGARAHEVSARTLAELSTYLERRWQHVRSLPACGCTYNGAYGAFKLVLRSPGIDTVRYLECRACSRLFFDDALASPDVPTGEVQGLVQELCATMTHCLNTDSR